MTWPRGLKRAQDAILAKRMSAWQAVRIVEDVHT